MSTRILTINVGSSSLKCALFDTSLQSLIRHEIADSEAADALINWALQQGTFNAVGHRIVHGGTIYSTPQRITPKVIETLRNLIPLSPNHLPKEIQLIEKFMQRFPLLPQIACFDTAFHCTLPRIAHMLPLPRCYEAKGIRRYGFHGLSYAFLMEKLKDKGRVILAHLGGGASLAAVHEGKALDTTMSFTPTSGIPMSTRSGDLDPGILLYLARTEGLDAKVLEKLVTAQSGLLGMSEISEDMRILLKTKDIRATEAISLFCYRIKKEIGALTAALGGLDTLVFTGGIGAHSPEIRMQICKGLEHLGIKLEETHNALNKEKISLGQVTVRCMVTDEEYMIAKYVHNEVFKHG